MKYNIKELVLETVSEVLLEGRLEDVKAKYDEEFSDIIDDMSRLDPSGNNKYLAWMANQYFSDETNTPSVTQLSDAVDRFHKELARINSKLSTEVVENNPNLYLGRSVRRVSNNPKDINSYPSIEALLKVVEASKENVPVSTERDKIYQDDKWTVIIPKTHKASCKYGVHSGWCVSVDNDHYFKRYTEDGMLAFVLWRGKQEGQRDMERDGEYKVAVNIKYDRPNYKDWEWWNKKDTQMDNDLPLAVFPPALIEAIKNSVRGQMKSSGWLVEVDFEEVEQKSHVLKTVGQEGEQTWTFTPKKEFGLEWLKKYDKRNYINLSDSVFKSELPIFSLSEPRGDLAENNINLVDMYRRLSQERDYWSRNDSKKKKFMDGLPYNLRSSGYRESTALDSTKKEELWEYFKTYFVENFNGYLNVNTSSLRVGDEVRWKRKPAREQRRLGSKVGKIVRQTPSGMFVVDIDGEDKPSRFKPSPDKYMDKKFNYENLNANNLFVDDPNNENIRDWTPDNYEGPYTVG
jgi:hypothetical protein